MGHYDSCREAAKRVEIKKEAYSYYEAELNQLASAVELIKALANGYGENADPSLPTLLGEKAPQQACDKWLMANGYECEATRAAQKAKKLAEIEAKIERLQKEKESL